LRWLKVELRLWNWIFPTLEVLEVLVVGVQAFSLLSSQTLGVVLMLDRNAIEIALHAIFVHIDVVVLLERWLELAITLLLLRLLLSFPCLKRKRVTSSIMIFVTTAWFIVTSLP